MDFLFSRHTPTKVSFPSYISSGNSMRKTLPCIFIQPKTPDTAMNASRAETIRNSRLFPVLTAAKPDSSVRAMYEAPALLILKPEEQAMFSVVRVIFPPCSKLRFPGLPPGDAHRPERQRPLRL